jgi:acetyltransferase-like isoleucine patch superfamily enzyme
MKRRASILLNAGLVPILRLTHVISGAFHLPALCAAFRQATWKTRLLDLGDDTHIFDFVVIHDPKCVRIGSRCAIAEFVHIWGGWGRRHRRRRPYC